MVGYVMLHLLTFRVLARIKNQMNAWERKFAKSNNLCKSVIQTFFKPDDLMGNMT